MIKTKGWPKREKWRYYVGVTTKGLAREVFRSKTPPTYGSHGDTYCYVVGPFHRKMDAVDFVEHKHYMAPTAVLSTSFRACRMEE